MLPVTLKERGLRLLPGIRIMKILPADFTPNVFEAAEMFWRPS